MLVRQLQEHQLSQEDAAFEKKWQVSFREINDFASQFTIWKKFLKTAPGILDREDYEEIPVKLWDEDFQLPPLKSSIHDDEIYSQDADSRQEYEAHLLDEQLHPHQRTLSIEELKHQLEIWSPRNLTIFFIEYLLDSEIASLKIFEAGHSTDLESLADRIPKVETLYQHILKTLNTADYYITEPAIYDPTYNIHPKKFDIALESRFLRQSMDNLSMLGSSKQLELLKLKIRIESYGIVLPHSDEILKIAGLSDKQCQQEMDAILAANKLAAEQAEAEKAAAEEAAATEPESNQGSLRKSKRVTSHLHTLGETCDSDHDDEEDDKDDEAKPLLTVTAASAASTSVPRQPAASSLAKDILFGIVVGLAVSILVAGVVAAVIFASAATLGGAALGLIFGGIFGAGIIGGFFGGVMKFCCQPHTAQPAATPSVVKTNNAAVNGALGLSRSTVVSPSSPAQEVKKGNDEAIVRAPSASLASQSQKEPAALTPSGIRH